MTSITQKTASVSSPTVPTDTVGQWNPVDSMKLPVVCVGCYAEAHRELPHVCTMQPCPKHAHNQHASIGAAVDEAFITRLEQVCTNLVNLRAPSHIINPLRTAPSVEALSIALSAAEFWLSPCKLSTRLIEVQR